MTRPSAPDRAEQRATAAARAAAARENPRQARRDASIRQAAARQSAARVAESRGEYAPLAGRGRGPVASGSAGSGPYLPTARPAVPVDEPGSAWQRFVLRWGWRAYALPVLVVLTVLALVTTKSPKVVRQVLSGNASGGHNAAASGPGIASPDQQVKSDQPAAGSVTSVLKALQLPPGPAYTTQGAGTFAVIPGASPVIGHGTVHRFTIEVEKGITGVDLNQFASIVMSALSNQQSWIATGNVALQRVDAGPVDFHVTLVSSMTVRSLCGYDLPLETSCYAQSPDSRVVLNVARWVRGAKAYAGDLATYRLYAVNHEVGHALGHNHSHECLSGGLAPVMMQQTIGTKTASGAICQPNPWPYPKGVADAPGPEEPGDAADLDFFRRNST